VLTCFPFFNSSATTGISWHETVGPDLVTFETIEVYRERHATREKCVYRRARRADRTRCFGCRDDFAGSSLIFLLILYIRHDNGSSGFAFLLSCARLMFQAVRTDKLIYSHTPLKLRLLPKRKRAVNTMFSFEALKTIPSKWNADGNNPARVVPVGIY
jgi:hypothetical protein